MRRSVWRDWLLCNVMLCGACTSTEPQVVASNCDRADHCAKQEALHLDAVDILLVIDDSSSVVPKTAALKAQLPRMLTAITTGTDAELTFPPVNSVHVAVTTTDMSIGNDGVESCLDSGIRDGVFVRPAEVGLTCDVTYPGYLAFEGGAAPIATVNSVACVPLVSPRYFASGCIFEQPLEAGLKALWPADNAAISFLSGTGHGGTENAGFLRDSSLLVVVIVTDEDDCSAQDLDLFADPQLEPAPLGPLFMRCVDHADKLYDVQRYVTNLKQLRPKNDNVVFAVIAGIPPEFTADNFRSHYDWSNPREVDSYYQDVLGDGRMQIVATDDGLYSKPSASCWTEVVPTQENGFMSRSRATPPRRLVQVAQGFGANAVLGSICATDFGSTTGQIIHAIGQRLVSASGK